ncbi:related to 5`-nucleotidase precursor [Cephalotrichum gorgonifer]|uniref:Related to 5`-nucleotidase n=1 Tax=Cephalotrichum gorgonifer TaxID=2041049 RepID=A0AAE8SV37_9PEZI|nr:related to 5`-nucleotidase precursor [Cephalotrichum gorgonifer]
MHPETPPSSDPVSVFSSGRAHDSPPDLRLLHFNDVYHVDPSSAEPVGGIGRFMSVVREYREHERYAGQPGLIPLFSGDSFNPSVESTVTKGSHMVTVLNAIGTQCAAVGNHDLDFGVNQFTHLASQCSFPWLIANVLDPALGPNVPLGNAKPTHMLTSSNGLKIGLIGLGEREWLGTINSLPPNLIYKSASATARELVPQLRAQGADIIVALTHMREPNDNKLAEQTDGLIDIILGGHDHYYAHSLIRGTHVLRSGSDFKQLSYLEARRRPGTDPSGPPKWDFEVIRRDVVSSVPEDDDARSMVEELTSRLRHSLAKSIGWTATPLDARFTTVRREESNIGNFVCDIMRAHYSADCALMAAGTIRGDQIYPPGAIRVRDIVTCFPFEDPVVLMMVTGRAVREALENGVSLYPALEGRFPQVSNIKFTFDPALPPGSRVTSATIGGEDIQPNKKYKLATRGYMSRGKDGFKSLLVEPEGGDAEELVDEENGILISTMLRQYFMALRTVGRWKYLDMHWESVASDCSPIMSRVPSRELLGSLKATEAPAPTTTGSSSWSEWLARRTGVGIAPEEDSDAEDEVREDGDERIEVDVLLMKKYFSRWADRAGVNRSTCDALAEDAIDVDWTRVIAPVLEERITIVGKGVLP